MMVPRVMMVVLGVDAADVVMMPRLRGTGIVLVADDLGAVFAELAVHCRLAFAQLANPVAKRVEHALMVAQIERLDELDLGEETSDLVGLRVDALDQHAGEQEIEE